MPTRVRAKVKPALLTWARESIGYTLAEAAKRVGVSEERLAEWENENGTSAPTISQLQTLADAYKRPLALFYLAEVPRTFQPMRDFRRLPGSGMRRISHNLALEIRQAKERRQLALELSEEADEEPLRFSLRATLSDDPERIGEHIVRSLRITSEERARWRVDPQGYAAFNAWRSHVEEAGVLVFQADRVASDEVSGFAIAEEVLPVIVVSRADTPAARRTFSLLHEFAHLMLRMSGVSDLDVDAARPPEDQRVEIFCNQVAAAALMPKDDFLGERALRGVTGAHSNWTDETIRELARAYSVSREAVVRRLLTFGLTTRTFYQRKRAAYQSEFKSQRESRRERLKEAGGEFSRNPPRDVVTNIGKPLVRMILDSYHQERMSLSDVSGYLGIRTRHVPKLEDIVWSRGV